MESITNKYHLILAEYFTSKPLNLDKDTKGKHNVRKLVEQPFQQAQLTTLDKLKVTLTSFIFMTAKLEALGIYNLCKDFDQKAISSDKDLAYIQKVLHLSTHILSKDRTQFACQIISRLTSISSPGIQKFLESIYNWKETPWLRPITTSLFSSESNLLRIIEGVSGPVSAIATTTDGRIVASMLRVFSTDGKMIGPDFLINEYEITTGKFIRTLTEQKKGIMDLAVTPDDKLLIVAQENIINVIDIDSCEHKFSLVGHKLKVNAVSVTTDGKAISVSEDTTIKIWDLTSGQVLKTLEEHSKPVVDVVVTKRKIISMSYECINVWNAETYNHIITINPTSKFESFTSIASINDNEIVAAVSNPYVGYKSPNKYFVIWNLTSGTIIKTLVSSQRFGKINHIITTKNDKIIAKFSDYSAGITEVLDIISGQVEYSLEDTARDGDIALSEDGLLVTSSNGHNLKLWEIGSSINLNKIHKHKHFIRNIALTSDGRAISASDTSIKIWKLNTGAFLNEIMIEDRYEDWIIDMAVMKDGNIVTVSNNKKLKIWDLNSGKLLNTLKGNIEDYISIALTKDDYAVYVSNKNVKIWNIYTDQQVWTLETDKGNGFTVISKDKIVLDDFKSQPKVFDIIKGKMLYELERSTRNDFYKYPIKRGGIKISAEGNRLYALKGLTIYVWDIITGKLIHTADYFEGKSPWNYNLTIYDLTGNNLTITILNQLGRNDNSTLHVWENISERIIASYNSDSKILMCKVASNDSTIVVGDESGNVHFLKLILPENNILKNDLL